MQAFFSLAAIAALIAPSFAAAVPRLDRRDAGLKVELSQVAATQVNAVMTNTGSEALKLLDYGTLMDKNPVQKLNVFKDGVEVGFTGIDASYRMFDLPEDAFTTLAPGESFASLIDIAALHEVSGGDYTVSTIGAIPYAAENTTELAGSIVYQSNVIALNISEDDVSVVPRAIPVIDKRTILRSCTGSQGTAHRASLSQLISVAQTVANAARTGSATKFQEFFKTTASSSRSNVAARYDAIQRESSSTTSGATNYYCTDPYGYCSSNVLAYALPSQNLIANCPLYYTLTRLSSACRTQDQVTTALHEFTHTPGVFSPGTQDYAYGYSASTQLSSSQALNNADTYALYANAIINGC